MGRWRLGGGDPQVPPLVPSPRWASRLAAAPLVGGGRAGPRRAGIGTLENWGGPGPGPGHRSSRGRGRGLLGGAVPEDGGACGPTGWGLRPGMAWGWDQKGGGIWGPGGGDRNPRGSGDRDRDTGRPGSGDQDPGGLGAEGPGWGSLAAGSGIPGDLGAGTGARGVPGGGDQNPRGSGGGTGAHGARRVGGTRGSTHALTPTHPGAWTRSARWPPAAPPARSSARARRARPCPPWWPCRP